MKYIQRLFVIGVIAGATFSTNVQAVAFPTVKLPMGEELVSNLCFDSGYVRAKNFTNKQNIQSILKKTVLKFIDGSEFIKNDFIAEEYKYYNSKTQKFEKQSISECSTQLIDKSFTVKETYRDASNSETVFYGNLKNYGVNDTAMETWKKWKSLDRFLQYSAEKDRVTLVTDFSKLSEQSQLNDFSAWKDLSGKVIGGEQSGGGGSGKVRVNMNMAADQIQSYRSSQNSLERFFGASSFIERIIFDNKKVSKSRIYVTVPQK